MDRSIAATDSQAFSTAQDCEQYGQNDDDWASPQEERSQCESVGAGAGARVSRGRFGSFNGFSLRYLTACSGRFPCRPQCWGIVTWGYRVADHPNFGVGGSWSAQIG